MSTFAENGGICAQGHVMAQKALGLLDHRADPINLDAHGVRRKYGKVLEGQGAMLCGIRVSIASFANYTKECIHAGT